MSASVTHAGEHAAADRRLGFFSTLKTVVSDLINIRNQNRLLLVIFSNVNKDKVDGCVDRLAAALDKFNVILSNSTLYALLTFRIGWERFAPS